MLLLLLLSYKFNYTVGSSRCGQHLNYSYSGTLLTFSCQQYPSDAMHSSVAEIIDPFSYQYKEPSASGAGHGVSLEI